MPAAFQTTIAVHELTHALQDQYFDLQKFVDAKTENSDLLLAHSALVEGDATAVMIDYDRIAFLGLKPLATEPNVEAVLLAKCHRRLLHYLCLGRSRELAADVALSVHERFAFRARITPKKWLSFR